MFFTGCVDLICKPSLENDKTEQLRKS